MARRPWLWAALLAAAVLAMPAALFELLVAAELARSGGPPELPRLEVDRRFARADWVLREGTARLQVEPITVLDLVRPGTRQPTGRQTVWWATRLVARREGSGRAAGPWTSYARAVWLSRHATAWQLERIVFDRAKLGRGAGGTEAAARAYFGKELARLDLAQQAVLIGLQQRPSRLDPARFPERALKRRTYVLRVLEEEGVISMTDRIAADGTPMLTLRRAGEVASPLAAASN